MVTPRNPAPAPETQQPGPLAEDDPGSNRTQHEPNPREKPVPLGDEGPKRQQRGPYTTGND